MKTLEDRFWAKVDKSGACWEWMGYTDPRSKYGRVRVEGRTAYSHRVAYEMQVGPIPAGMLLDHTCHVRHCVNPSHLRVVTNKQNTENRAACNAGNPSGVRGVFWYKPLRKWGAKVCHNGTRYHVGYFPTIAEAESAVIAKRNELFTHNLADRSAA